MRICPACQDQVVNDASICERCGRRLRSIAQADENVTVQTPRQAEQREESARSRTSSRRASPEPEDWDEPILILALRRPSTVTAAGVIWIVCGSLLLAYFLGITIHLLIFDAAADREVAVGLLICLGWIPTLVSLMLLYIGVQTLRGKSKGIGGNAAGSIVLAVVQAVMATVFLGSLLAGRQDPLAVVVHFFMNMGSAVALLVAGIMALVGQHRYDAWRQSIGRPCTELKEH